MDWYNQFESITHWLDRTLFIITLFLQRITGTSGDLIDEFIKASLTTLLLSIAFIVTIKYKERPKERLLCYGFLLGLFQSLMMQGTILYRIWYHNTLDSYPLWVGLAYSIKHLCLYTSAVIIALAFSCYTAFPKTKTPNKCIKKTFKVTMPVGLFLFAVTASPWANCISGSINKGIYACADYSFYNLFWHLITAFAVLYTLKSNLLRKLGATWVTDTIFIALLLWVTHGLLVSMDILLGGYYRGVLTPLSSLIYMVSTPLLLFTYIREQEDKLEFSNNRAKSLAADRSFIIRGFTHEIRTPLMALSSFIDAYSMQNELKNNMSEEELRKLCPKGLLCNKITNEGFEDMRMAVRHISNVIDNLSSFGEDTTAHKLDYYDLTSLTKIGVKYSKFTDEAKAIESDKIVFNTPEEPVMVYISPSKYIQILQNLLRNSVKAVILAKRSEPDINVSLQLDREQNKCVVSVYDNGVGMTTKEITNCTKKYWTTRKESKGGLGLYLVKTYMKEFGGKLSIKSVKNKYTKVNLIFPLKNKQKNS